MKFLVTGSEGFVGQHLVRELRDHGHEVVGVDKDVIPTFGANCSAHIDLAVPGQAKRAVEEAEPDYVVHLAARYGRLLCAAAPHQSVTDNAAATTELAEACAQHNIPVLYTSSSEVYGDHGEDTITEESELRMPTTIYGLSKLWGEEVLNLYMDPEQVCTVRMNMLYGPRQAAGWGRCALATFIEQALKGEEFTVHRGTTRSWLYISDAVRALRLLIEGGHSGVYNLGNEGERRPMAAVAELVGVLTGSGFDVIRYADPPANQIRHKNYSSAKLRKTVNWTPEVGLVEGIRQTVESAKESLWQTRARATA